MKKFLSKFLITALLAMPLAQLNIMVPAAFAAPEGFTGNGIEEDPYIISSCASLMFIDDMHMDMAGTFFELTEDLDCTADGNNVMIASPLAHFDDNFNGNGYSITIALSTTDSYTGLFSYTEDANIHDLEIYGTVLVDGGGSNGVLIGRAETTTVSDVYIDADILTDDDNIGLLAGAVLGGSIENVNVQGTVTGLDNVGGLAGEIACETQISDSTANSDVTGTYNVGGFVGFDGGECEGASIYNSTSEGTVTGIQYVGGFLGTGYYNYLEGVSSEASVNAESYAGGLVGQDYNATFTSVYSVGTVEGVNFIGGLAGTTNTIAINDSYSTSNVTVLTTEDEQGYSIGGLIGFADPDTIIDGSHSSGNVHVTLDGSTESDYVGGLVGVVASDIYITNSYSTSDITFDVIEPEYKYVRGVGGLVGGLCVDDTGCHIDTSYYNGSILIDQQQTDEPEGGFAAENIGGLVGAMYNADTEDTITESYSAGDISVISSEGFSPGFVNNVGGFIGVLEIYTESSPTISNNYSRTNITIDNSALDAEYVAGFIGWNDNTTNYSIENNYAANEITLNVLYSEYVAGFIGTDENGVTSIYNNFAVPTFDITVGDAIEVSATFIGYDDSIDTEILDNNYVYDVNDMFDFCYGSYPEETSGCDFTESEDIFKMDEFVDSGNSNEPLASWNFGEVWTFVNGVNNNYPILQNIDYGSLVPVVTTNEVTDIGEHSATLHGTVESGAVGDSLFGFFIAAQENAEEWFFAVPGPIEVESAGDDYEFEVTEEYEWLDCETTYYVQAMGEYYGGEEDFVLFVADNEVSFTCRSTRNPQARSRSNLITSQRQLVAQKTDSEQK